jgi:O-antigen ligase
VIDALPAARNRAAVAAWGLFAVLAALAALVILHHPTSRIGAAAGAFVCFVAFVVANQRRLFAWPTMLATIVLVLLLIPIRRYNFVSGLPFNLEIYRLLLFVVGALWVAALLIDPAVRFRRSIIDIPFAVLGFVYLASLVASGSRLNQPGLTSAAIKQISILLGFLLMYFLITSLVVRFEDVEAVLRVLVGGGAVVAFFSLVEARTQWNAFDHLAVLLPFLRHTDQLSADALSRGGHLRVLASAEHPIALSALLVMLVPLGVYLAERTRQRRWWLATILILGAALSTLSRTGIVMLVVTVVVLTVLRPAEMGSLFRRSLKFILPLLIAVHLALPGTLGTFNELFFANGGLIAQQSGGQVGSGRVASFGPGLRVVGQHPLLGVGYGTRITDSESPYKNSFITDDGWLATAMEAGLLAVLAWLGIFLSYLIRLGRAARRDRTARGRLLAACTASTTAFAVGMATYDALSFLQVTFALFIVLALGAVAYRAKDVPLEIV